MAGCARVAESPARKPNFVFILVDDLGWNDWAISTIKRFQLAERVRLELRGEGTNFFNHPNFGGPSLSPTSTTFGQITYSETRTINLQGQLQW